MINEEKLEKWIEDVSNILDIIHYLLDPKRERCREKTTREFELGMLHERMESLEGHWRIITHKREVEE